MWGECSFSGTDIGRCAKSSTAGSRTGRCLFAPILGRHFRRRRRRPASSIRRGELTRQAESRTWRTRFNSGAAALLSFSLKMSKKGKRKEDVERDSTIIKTPGRTLCNGRRRGSPVGGASSRPDAATGMLPVAACRSGSRCFRLVNCARKRRKPA